MAMIRTTEAVATLLTETISHVEHQWQTWRAKAGAHSELTSSLGILL